MVKAKTTLRALRQRNSPGELLLSLLSRIENGEITHIVTVSISTDENGTSSEVNFDEGTSVGELMLAEKHIAQEIHENLFPELYDIVDD